MSGGKYDIDDILLEAQRLKEKAQNKGSKTAPSTPLDSGAPKLINKELDSAVSLAQELLDEQRKAAQLTAELTTDLDRKVLEQRIQEGREKQFQTQQLFVGIEQVEKVKAKEVAQREGQKPLFFRRRKEVQYDKNPELDFKQSEPLDTRSPRKERPSSSLEESLEMEKIQVRVEEPVAPPPPAPVNRRHPSGNQLGRGEGKGRVSLFDFQPTKGKSPIKYGPYGQKRFDFSGGAKGSSPAPVPAPAPSPQSKGPNPKLQPKGFDFDSISGKIDKLQKEDETSSWSVRQSYNPMDYTGAVKPLTEKALGGRKRYTDLATGQVQREFRFGQQARESEGEESFTEPEEKEESQRRSIFSTFPTGTGRELDLEDIKRIDFGAVEGSGSGFYDEEFDFGNDLPEGSFVSFKEYGPESDRRDVAREIANNKRSVFSRFAMTALLTIILIYLGFSAKYDLPILQMMVPEKSSLPTFVLINTIFTALVGVVCSNVMISGLVSVFKMRANSDTLAAFGIIGAVVQGLVAFQNPDLITPNAMNLYFPVAALAMLFNCMGKLFMLERIQQNFRVAASNQEKYGVLPVDSLAFMRDMLPNHTQQRPTIAYSAQGDFFTEYMALSYSNKYDVGIHRSVAPVSIGGAFVVALATRFLTSDSFVAATAFAGVLCISATFSSTFIENIPLAKMAKKLPPMGAMVSGNKAVETFCDTDAVVLAENDLFPKGHVYLNGIKAFPGGKIDEAILDAASVLCALGGSLSHVFLDMIGGNKALLKKVDNVVYENGMGLSGWVDGRRVLIGNRGLMKNHGVPLPEDSYERKYPHETPGNPIYLSNTGIVSARFLVEYTVDEALAHQLDKLAEKDISLIVYTTDANIDAAKIWELYNYPVDHITIMASELQDDFREMSQPRQEIPAEIVYTGHPASFIAAIVATINARSSILSATVVMLAQIILGYALVALMSFMGYIESFSMVRMIFYQLAWFGAITLIQQLRRP